MSKNWKQIGIALLLGCILLLVGCGESGIERAHRINKQLYRFRLKTNDGIDIKKGWAQEVIETDSSIQIYRMKLTNKKTWWAKQKPELWGVEFDKAVIDTFFYWDISDSLKYYRNQ